MDSPVTNVDIDTDGYPDLVYAYREGASTVLETYINGGGSGQGWGRPVARYRPPQAFVSTREGDLGWRFADLDGDGRLDLLWSRANAQGETSSGAYRNTERGFVEGREFVAPAPFVIEPGQVGAENIDTRSQLFDVNGDRLPDLIVSYMAPGAQSPTRGVYLGAGRGFSETSVAEPPVRFDSAPQDRRNVAFFDFNRDGQTDILSVTSSAGEVYLGSGPGWVRARTYDLPAAARSDLFNFDTIRIVDVTGDSAPDLVFNTIQRDGSYLRGGYINTGAGWRRAEASFTPDQTAEAFVREIHRRLIDLYFDEGWSNGAVASYGGCSAASVKKLVRQAAAKGRTRSKIWARDPRKRQKRRPLSRTHALIGIRVARYRATHRLSMVSFGDRVRLSRFRVAQVESGAYDLTILEVAAIANELGQSLDALFARTDQQGRSPR